jgi:hypothetical protein
MNCRPGDLAVVVRACNAENLGGLVRVVGPGMLFDWHIDPLFDLRHVVDPHTRAGIRPGGGRLYVEADDVQLRPIRDQDGEDETLTWAGKPQQVPA